MDELRPYSLSNDDVIIVGIILLFALLAHVYMRGQNSLQRKVATFFKNRKTINNEEVNITGEGVVRNTAIMLAVSCVSLSMMNYDYVRTSMADPEDSPTFGVFALGFLLCAAYICGKALIHRFIGWVFFETDDSRNWIAAYFFLTSLTAFVILPLSLMQVFFRLSFSIVTFCLCIMFVLYEIFLFYKLFSNFKGDIYGSLLIILYFCSVEVLPSIALFNILTN